MNSNGQIYTLTPEELDSSIVFRDTAESEDKEKIKRLEDIARYEGYEKGRVERELAGTGRNKDLAG